MVEALNAALDLVEHAKHARRLRLEGVDRALWQARAAIDAALAAWEREEERRLMGGSS